MTIIFLVLLGSVISFALGPIFGFWATLVIVSTAIFVCISDDAGLLFDQD